MGMGVDDHGVSRALEIIAYSVTDSLILINQAFREVNFGGM